MYPPALVGDVFGLVRIHEFASRRRSWDEKRPVLAHSLLRQVVGLLRIAVTCKIEIASARKED